MRAIIILITAVLFSLPLRSQMIDKIDGIIGEDIILKSDIEAQYAYFIANGQKDDGTLRCQIMEKLIVEKLLLNKARQDSIEVSEEQVTAELNRKLDYFIQGYGSVEKVEEIYRKPLIEIKADLRPDIEDQLKIDRMRQKIVGDVRITPREVKKFYSEIPKDSLPFLPAEVEMFHLVKMPKASDESQEEAKKKLQEIRKWIIDGDETFGEMAGKYSLDFSSGKAGGMLPEFSRGRMVPEFEEMAFKTKVGEISPVFATAYGFHILKVEKRVGELITARHILLSPRITLEDDSLALGRLAEIREMIVGADTLTFIDASRKYTDDESTKPCGGCIKNPQTGELSVPLDLLDADFYLKVDGMKVGEITEPMEWIQPDGKKSFHMIYLQSKTPPHVANLKDDYRKIQEAALQAKQSLELQKWFDRAKRNIYIEIKDPDCREILSNWIQ